MLTRRSAIFLSTAFSFGLGWGRASAASRTLRIGYQKGEPVLVAAKQNCSFEQLLKPRGIAVTWVEFPFGPPMLEAMRVDSIDIGGVGDTPPIFAQAAHAPLVYIAARPSSGNDAAILLPAGSKLRALHDLKGKRIAFARGSSAENLTIAALEKGGVAFSDIQPIYLAPGDAAAAFRRGAIDAWTIWDPYFAVAQTWPGVRVLASSKDITAQNSFYLASRSFAAAQPKLTQSIIAELGKVGAWCDSHHPQVARLLAAATGVPLPDWRRAVDRASFRSVPMNPALFADQQQIADRFQRLGVIPAALNVRAYAIHPNV